MRTLADAEAEKAAYPLAEEAARQRRIADVARREGWLGCKTMPLEVEMKGVHAIRNVFWKWRDEELNYSFAPQQAS